MDKTITTIQNVFHVKYRIYWLIFINFLSYMHVFYLFHSLSNMLSHFDPSISLLSLFIFGDAMVYIFLGVTSFEIAKGINNEYKSISKIGMLDWLIRFFAYILVYQIFRFDWLLINKDYFFILLIGFMLLSIFLELKMQRKMKRIKQCNNQDSHHFSAREVHHLPNMEKAVAIGALSIVIVYPIGISFLLTIPFHSILRMIIQIFISIILLIWFIKNEKIKFKTFFLGKGYKSYLPWRNSIIALFGYIISFILGSDLFQISNHLKDSALIIAMLFALPSYYITYQMSVKIAKTRKFKNENYG